VRTLDVEADDPDLIGSVHTDRNLPLLLITIHRYIFYQNEQLFGTQRYVDRMVDNVASTFGVSRDALNIVGTLSLISSHRLLNFV
jgi:hypothetical protein